MIYLIALATIFCIGMLVAEVTQKLTGAQLSQNQYLLVALLWWVIVPLAMYNSFMHPTTEEDGDAD